MGVIVSGLGKSEEWFMARRRRTSKREAEGCVWLLVIALVIGVGVTILQGAAGVLGVIWPLFLVIAVAVLVYKTYESVYFHGKAFASIRTRIQDHITDCNELNEHIESLKTTQLAIEQARYGHSDYHDNSNWNYKRSELGKISYAPYVYSCSRTVCDNSRKNPMQYVCKYFGFKADEDTLAVFEQMLNDFVAVEDGRKGLVAQRSEILDGISNEVPSIIRKFSAKRLEKELGFETVDLSDAWYPRFVFQYVSSGGNASTENTIVMDVSNLEAMVNYLNGRIKWKKSAAYQRSLMTRSLRSSILVRDNHTCQYCGVSLADEPHLLLEVDHIVPVSKGGLTSMDNLQTLCWRCNRSKGAKVSQ